MLLAFLAKLPFAALKSLETLLADFSNRLPHSAFLAVNAICQDYQRHPSHCLPLSTFLAVNAPAAFRFRLFSPLPTPSGWAINAIPPTA
jgi:hypothetical protein